MGQVAAALGRAGHGDHHGQSAGRIGVSRITSLQRRAPDGRRRKARRLVLRRRSSGRAVSRPGDGDELGRGSMKPSSSSIVVSERLIERIDEMLGHPTRDPHGDPHPQYRRRHCQPRARHAAHVPLGARLRVTRIADQDPDFLRFTRTPRLETGPGSRSGARATRPPIPSGCAATTIKPSRSAHAASAPGRGGTRLAPRIAGLKGAVHW